VLMTYASYMCIFPSKESPPKTAMPKWLSIKLCKRQNCKKTLLKKKIPTSTSIGFILYWIDHWSRDWLVHWLYTVLNWSLVPRLVGSLVLYCTELITGPETGWFIDHWSRDWLVHWLYTVLRGVFVFYLSKWNVNWEGIPPMHTTYRILTLCSNIYQERTANISAL